MANSFLSPTIITREALRVLHANLNFIGSINRQYDDQFANSGASPSGKIGPALTIRMPNQCTVRSGSVASVQDITETSQTLTVSTVKGVDFTHSANDLTLTIDEFSARYLQPFMARLASEIEKDALTMVKDVYNMVDNDTNPVSFLNFMQGRQKLNEYLAPDDGKRVGLLCPTHNTKYIDATKGLFTPSNNLGAQYRKGKVQNPMAGFEDFYENTLLVPQTTGTAAKTTGYSVDNSGVTSGATITVKTGTTTFLIGDVITIATLNAVHPETKADLGYLQQFTVTADSGASAVLLSISPAIVYSGATKNVSTASLGADRAIVKIGAGASETYTQSLVYHPDAFTFVSADLVDPSKFGAWGTRQVMDGISMRIARQWDFTNDKVPTRIDVLYGFKTIRPQLACRIHADG